MTIGPTELLALSPLLVTVATAVAVMLSVAWRRHHFVNATLTVVGLTRRCWRPWSPTGCCPARRR